MEKRILICASRVSHILNFHLPYIEYFKNKNYRVDIAVEGTTDNSMIDNCYDMKFTKNPFSPDNLKTIGLLKKIMSENNYDIIYSNSTLAGAASRIAVKSLKNKPYIIHISHGYMFGDGDGIKSKLYLLAEKLTGNVTDNLVVMNKDDLELAEKYHLGKNIYYINGMGLVSENFPEISNSEKSAIRQSIGVSDDMKMLLCVGEFSKRKNQTAVIEAFDMLLKKHKDIMLVFAGEGDMLEVCRQLSHKYELDTNIRFLGQVEDICKLYRCSDILVTASKMEGLPFNVMEALYCALPVVATDIKGHRDLISHGKNGLLTHIDYMDIYSKLDEILSDTKLYSYIKKNTFLDEKYLIKNAEPELLKILDKEYTEEFVT